MFRRAGFWIRVGAFALDALILIAVGIAIGFGMAFIVENEAKAERISLALGYLMGLGYWSFEIFKAASPGKIALKLWIGNADGSAAPISRLVLRWNTKQFATVLALISTIPGAVIFEWLSHAMSVVLLLSCLMVLRGSRRAWHDDWAGTAVFRPGQEEQRGFEPILTAARADHAGASGQPQIVQAPPAEREGPGEM